MVTFDALCPLFTNDADLFSLLYHIRRVVADLRYNKTAYRLFAFWDKDEETLVIATHGIIKKTQKTPSKEIAKAEAIRKEYFKNK